MILDCTLFFNLILSLHSISFSCLDFLLMCNTISQGELSKILFSQRYTVSPPRLATNNFFFFYELKLHRFSSDRHWLASDCVCPYKVEATQIESGWTVHWEGWEKGGRLYNLFVFRFQMQFIILNDDAKFSWRGWSWKEERALGKESGNSRVFPRCAVLRLAPLSYLSESAEGTPFKLGIERITLGYTVSLYSFCSIL